VGVVDRGTHGRLGAQARARRAIVPTDIIRVVLTYLAASAGVISTTGAITNYVLGAIFITGFGYYGWVKTAAATT
jgi:riboflavin transporter FmnP